MRKCELIITDSGGIQEEATAPAIRKPVLVVRLSTERPEAVEAGFAEVVGTDKEKALKAIESVVTRRRKLPTESPFGDGTAAEKIVKIIQSEI
jgi:UDP-N-acetylglucosamine 2-epimerase (non-hydrolysing)